MIFYFDLKQVFLNYSSIYFNPKCSYLLSGLGIFKKASTSPTAGINSGINGFNYVSISIS